MTARLPRQDSTTAQLHHVSRLAVQAGCYDADDVIRQHLADRDKDHRFFRLAADDCDKAVRALKALDDQLGIPHPVFVIKSSGNDCSVYTNHMAAQRLFRSILIYLGIPFEESDKEQIRTILDGNFGF